IPPCITMYLAAIVKEWLKNDKKTKELSKNDKYNKQN
ncbi:unnamed protein product, partial [marine sediment metagenome]